MKQHYDILSAGVRVLLLGLLLGVTACKKGVPEINSLNKTLTGFSVDQSAITVSNKNTPSFTVSGKCNSKFSDVQLSIDGGTSWYSVAQYGTSTVSCSSRGTFSANLSFASGVLASSKWTSTGVYSDLRLKAYSSLGFSETTSLTLNYQNPTSGMPGQFTAGGSNAPLTGPGYILKGELTSMNVSPAMAGGNYKMHGVVLWQ